MVQLLSWDGVGEKFFENGVDRGVLYIPNGSGVYDTGFAWNGLTNVTESPSGAEASPFYADNQKYANLQSAEEWAGTIEAYTYPDEFQQCLGELEFGEAGIVIGQQARVAFGFCYRSNVGNDVDPELGYKLHLIYGLLAAPSEKSYDTINDSPEPTGLSWEVSSTPAPATGFKATSVITIDSTKVTPANLTSLETLLYGDDVGPTQPALPTPDEVYAIFSA